MSFRTRLSRISLLDHVLELMTHDSRLMTFHAGQVFALREDLRGVEHSAAEPQPRRREGCGIGGSAARRES
jgi:hypothetical protein